VCSIFLEAVDALKTARNSASPKCDHDNGNAFVEVKVFQCLACGLFVDEHGGRTSGE
jgi:hypothetical protein